MDAVDALVAEMVGPRRGGSEVKGSDLTGPSPEKLQAERGAHEAQTAGHHKSVAVDAFIFAQVHVFFFVVLVFTWIRITRFKGVRVTRNIREMALHEN